MCAIKMKCLFGAITSRRWGTLGLLLFIPMGASLFAQDESAVNGPVKTLGEGEAEVDPSEDEVDAEIPTRGILRFSINIGSRNYRVTTPRSALGKLPSLAKRIERGDPFSAAINVNNTIVRFDELQQFAATCMSLEQILAAIKQARISLGQLGPIEMSSQATHPAYSQTLGRRGRDGDDGLGRGGGLGGQSGGGIGLTMPQRSSNSNPSGQRDENAERQQRLELFRSAMVQLLRRGELVPNENDPEKAQAEKAVEKPKEGFSGAETSGKATLLGRATHGDYDKATYSFEFGIRDDPTVSIGNDWDLQYGSVPNHFHVTMVSDDRSRIVDLGNGKLDELDFKRLRKLPAFGFPQREFVQAVAGHVYLVHTVDRNTDLYALFRVDALEENHRCDISWKRIPAPGTELDD